MKRFLTAVILQVVLDEAILDRGHPLLGRLDRLGAVEQAGLGEPGDELELVELARAASRSAHRRCDREHLLAQLGEHGQRELSVLQFVRHLLIDAGQRPLHGTAADQTLTFVHEGAQLLHGFLDARSDGSGLLVAHRLGKLGARVRKRSQRVPSLDDIARRERNHVERSAQLGCRALQVLCEQDLLLATQRARATDFLEVGLKRSSLAPRIQILDGDSPGYSCRRSSYPTPARGRALAILQFHSNHLWDTPV
jgi:hypothetical protein